MPTILINGKVNARVVEKLSPDFELVYLATPDPGAVRPEMAADVRGIANFGAVPAALMDCFPHLEMIANFGVGYDGVDAVHAGLKGIIVTNTPDVLNGEVADTTIGLLLNTIRQFPAAEAWLRAGRWVDEGPFPLTPLSLQGRHVGLYGLGRIGLEIARRLEAFGLKISYHSRNPRADVPHAHHPSLLGLAKAVDTLICIVPKTPETFKTVNAEVLAALGENGVLINVGRGWTVDEDALAAALANGVIAAAGLDVFQDEPYVPDELLVLPNLTLLPHVASASVPTRNAMADLVAANLSSWFGSRRALTPVAETPLSHPA
jgi:lactate dehydrogenase-like 2-hydroxyacid dehydrogenase